MDNMFNPKALGLLGFGSSMLESGGYSPVRVGLGQALGRGIDAGLGGYQAGMFMQGQQADARRKQQQLLQQLEAQQFIKDYAQNGNNPSDVRSMTNAMIQSGNPFLLDQALKMAPLMPKVQSVQKVMKNGQAMYQPVMSTGEFGAVSGLPAADKLMQADLGGKQVFVNPYTAQTQAEYGKSMSPGESARLAESQRQFGANYGLNQQRLGLDMKKMAMEMNPEYQMNKAANQALAKEHAITQYKAQQELPRVAQQGEETIRLVDDLLKHPGFKISVGKSAPLGSLSSYIPGTDAASFDVALNQLKGKQFLEAFESLKGGGQITEIEGQKATQAMSRMEKSNSEEEFIRAAKEFQDIIRKGIDRARQKAGMQQSNTMSTGDGWGDLR